MYIHSVKLINYKSIGDYPESEIILEPGITVIIGKNESGKSNVIDGLSKINFLTINEDAFSRNAVNRNIATGSENRFIIIIKSDDRESTLGINVDTTIEITKNKCIVTGGLFEYYLQTIWPEFEEFVKLLNSISENPMQLNASDYSYYKSYKQELINRDNVDLYYKKKAINYFKNKITIFPKGNQDIIKAKLENLITLWDKYTSMFPTFFYRKSDKHLKTTYNIEDIKKELNPNVTTHSLLSELVQLIDISEDDFIFAATTGISSVQESLRSKIVRQIRKKINYPFNDFYGTEYIDLEISFNSGSISFKVQSEDGEALMLSERSDGLKWYLETFIDAQAHDIKGKNVVYLFDEPGTSLHINAQKELLTLFQDLSDKGNQIVYTTHYPHMLDLKNNGIHRIRAIVKNNEGFSNIYKTAYDSRIASESQQDTLAPIINAIGMSLNDTFGPAKDKLNIVVEGMSDYIYLTTMAKVLKINKPFVIIPAVGASNCVHIGSILHGWGCPYIVVFDYDNEGVRNGEALRQKMEFELNNQYCYVANVTLDEIDHKTYKKNQKMIEDLVTQEEIDRFYRETNTSDSLGKVLIAKLMCTAIENGNYQVGEECKENFRELFDRILEFH